MCNSYEDEIKGEGGAEKDNMSAQVTGMAGKGQAQSANDSTIFSSNASMPITMERRAIRSQGMNHQPMVFAWLFCVCFLGASFIYACSQEFAKSHGGAYPCVVSNRSVIQASSLVIMALIQVDFSIIIPYSFDLSSAMGWEAIGSGFLIGIRTGIFPVGAAIGRLLCRPWDQIFARRVLLSCFVIVGALQCCSAAILLWRNRIPTTYLPWLFLGVRLLASFPLGCINLLSRLMATKVTTSEEQVGYSVANLSFSNFGLFLGPFLSSVCASYMDQSTDTGDSTLVFEASALTAVLMAFIWAAVAFAMTFTLPANLELPLVNGTPSGGSDVSVDQIAPEQFSYDVRKAIMICCGTYTFERAFTVGAVEVATTFLLEDKFKWTPEKIGYCYSIVAMATLILGISYVALQRFVKVQEVKIVLGVALVSAVSVLLLFDFHLEDGWLLILADALIYSCGYITNGITDGLAFRAAMPGPGAMLENWQLGKVWISMLSRSLAAPVSRALASYFGQNSYASVQACICTFSVVSIWKLLALLNPESHCPESPAQDTTTSEPHEISDTPQDMASGKDSQEAAEDPARIICGTTLQLLMIFWLIACLPFGTSMMLASGAPSYEHSVVVARLNGRFVSGRPSNNLEEAGVLVHIFDRHDGAPDFIGNPKMWNPSLRCDLDLKVKHAYRQKLIDGRRWCDRSSASLVNAQHPDSFSAMGNPIGSNMSISQYPGIVLAPGPAAQHVMCAYPMTATTGRFYCDSPGRGPHCQPGCFNVNKCGCKTPGSMQFDESGTIVEFGTTMKDDCRVPTPGPSSFNLTCAYGADRLSVMMKEQNKLWDRWIAKGYMKPGHNKPKPEENETTEKDGFNWYSVFNEVILSTRNPSWGSDMIEAVFMKAHSSAEDKAIARRAHCSILRDERKVELLVFDSAKARPFSLYSRTCTTFSVSRPSVWYPALVLVGMSLWFQLQRTMHRTSYVASACISMISFGCSNYLFVHASYYLSNPLTHLNLVYVILFLFAFLYHSVLTFSSPEYQSEWKATMTSTVSTKISIVACAASIGVAQICGTISFQLDSVNSSANQAVVCLSVVLVSLFFYFYAGERCTKVQGLLFLVILAGTMLQSGLTQKLEIPGVSFLFILVSTVCYAISNITIRLTSMAGAPDLPRLILICFAIGPIAFARLAQNLYSEDFLAFKNTPWLLLWPFLNAVAEFLGMWNVIYCFNAPGCHTGIATAIIDSNSIVMLVMCFLVRGFIPQTERIIGMIMILFGVIALGSKNKS